MTIFLDDKDKDSSIVRFKFFIRGQIYISSPYVDTTKHNENIKWEETLDDSDPTRSVDLKRFSKISNHMQVNIDVDQFSNFR